LRVLKAKGLIADLDQVATAESVRCSDALTIDQCAVCAPQIVENEMFSFAADLGVATRCACTGNDNRVVWVAPK
jgi:excinuclease UvrABC ATPase subunit